ncbi:hypothetical protein [Sinorhizobium meliloti]|uniref:hypothetical protein n=1 Tax=Rhizobium meliloti TaxID=382 RepID=UPI003F17503F
MVDENVAGDLVQFTVVKQEFEASNLRGQMVLVAPEEDSRLVITEDQLASLVAGGDNKAFQWALAFFGAAVGFAQNLIAVLLAIHNKSLIKPGEAVLAMVCVAALAASIVRYFEAKRQGGSCAEIAKKIKSGKRHEIPA